MARVGDVALETSVGVFVLGLLECGADGQPARIASGSRTLGRDVEYWVRKQKHVDADAGEAEHIYAGYVCPAALRLAGQPVPEGNAHVAE